MRALSLLLLLSGLAACGGGGGGEDLGSIGPIHCAGLTGAVADSAVNCAGGCGADFSEAAVDGDLDTYAILQLSPAAAGSVALRATAENGVTYPAGTPAAVVYGLARSAGDSVGTTETISTYLDGALQETSNVGGNNGTISGDRPAKRSSMNTTRSFDAIELTYVQSGGTADVEVQVHEVCTSVD